MKSYLLILLSFLCFNLSFAGVKNFQIRSQAEFDALNKTLKEALKQGEKELKVTLLPGVYYYGEKHLDFSSLNYPAASIEIEGTDALLVAKDLGNERVWQDGRFDSRTKGDVMCWTSLVQSPSEVDVVDAESKLCKIRTPKKQKKQSTERCKGQFIQLTTWYDSKVYPIVRRDKRYIYFTASDLEYSSTYRHWNVNYDMAYGKVTPRYRTLSVSDVTSTQKICQASTFLNLWHSKLSSFKLHGLTFGPNNGKAPLIDTDMFDSKQLVIDHCNFKGVRGLVVKIWYTDNVTIQNNQFVGCYANGIESYNMSKNTQIIENTFRNHGLGLQQNFAVVCRGEDFLIKENTFRNFSYSAIGAGVWYGNKPKGKITGSVEGNDIAFEPDFYNDYAKHTLMDGGAIYIWTLCDKVSITGNTINRYRGVKDYRGIFCDDGGKNITVRNNTVTNIGDNCWCIDLRWVDHVTENVPDHNTGNKVSDNQVDGRIRFETKKP